MAGKFGDLSILLKALGVAVLLGGVKWLAATRGWEFIETLPLLTALMGGVVFTLAIIVAGVLADFKESERILGEFCSQTRRVYWDLALIVQGENLAAMRRSLLAVTRAVHADLRTGKSIHLREVYRPMEELDNGVVKAAAAGAPASPVRTVQVHLGNLVRIVDRLEVIVETTFVRAGYYFAAIVALAAIGGLTFTRLGGLAQSLFLYTFAVFLVVGLFLLIVDLDNPFGGDVSISLRQLEKLERWMGERVEGGAPAQA